LRTSLRSLIVTSLFSALNTDAGPSAEMEEVGDDDDLVVLPPPPKKVFELVDVDSSGEDEEVEHAPVPGILPSIPFIKIYFLMLFK